MNKILVPLYNDSELFFDSSYYAIELAKRIESKIFFLFISEPGTSRPESDHSAGNTGYERMKERINALLRQGGGHHIQVEYHFCSGEYAEAVDEFSKDHKISKIVVGLPRKKDIFFENANKKIERLKSVTTCQLLVVKSKEKKIEAEFPEDMSEERGR